MALISVSNNALSNITALPASIPTGALTLIKSITASASASIEFINGTNGVVLDGTYSSYVFKFIDLNPDTDGTTFEFNFSTDSGSNYNVTKTSTFFATYHDEADTATNLFYNTGDDLAQSTSNKRIAISLGNGVDEAHSGYLQVYNPSSNLYVKHFISRFSIYNASNYAGDQFTAGYGNTTSAIDAIKFQMTSGNFDGIIKMYGVK